MIELDFFDMRRATLCCLTYVQMVPERMIAGVDDSKSLFRGGYVIPHRFAVELLEVTKPFLTNTNHGNMSHYVTENNYQFHLQHDVGVVSNKSVTITFYDDAEIIECIEISEPAFYQLCMLLHMVMRCIQYSDNFNHYWHKNEYSNFRH